MYILNKDYESAIALLEESLELKPNPIMRGIEWSQKNLCIRDYIAQFGICLLVELQSLSKQANSTNQE